jgi:hypothetical protein
VDGESFADLLFGKPHPTRSRPLFRHYPHYSDEGGTPAASIRDGDYKLLTFFEDNHVELYNLHEDIGETTDLSRDQSGRAGELHRNLTVWQEQIEALIPRWNEHWIPSPPDGDPAID